MKYSIIYYERESGDCPVQEFIQQFDSVRGRPIIYARLALREEYGPQLKRPYADFLRDKICELRFKIFKKQVRTLYFLLPTKRSFSLMLLSKKPRKFPRLKLNAPFVIGTIILLDTEKSHENVS